MYLKELKLYGFKSFKEETKLKFEPGVTAIVGPNGCGKSNLADAVKWVLGEQSAKELRGSTMEDVIFNGTVGTEPVGMAGVSLTILNESNILPIDYDEVTISRKAYRSGESDYFINKSKVRLMDIQNLIMGTGIGTSAYSIMEQGKIDLILSSKPQDRRYIFEEASGITKYKARKKETLNKLERTQQNLQRINDIINEVERQLKSIQRKVKKAQRYKRKFEQLEKLELISSKIGCNRIEDQLSKFTTDSKEYDEKLDKINADIDDIRNKLSQVNCESDKVTKEFEALQDKLLEVSHTINELESKLSLSKERIKDLRRKIEDLELEAERINTKLNDVKRQLSEFDVNIEELQQEEENTIQMLGDEDKRLESIEDEISYSEKRVKETKVELFDHMSEETNVRNEVVMMTQDIRNYNNRLTRLNQEKKDLESEKDVLSSKMQDIESELHSLNQELMEEEDKRQNIERVLTQYKYKLETLTKEISNDRVEYNEVKSKHDLFKQLKQKYEGFSSCIKTLIKLKEEKKLKFDILADIIQVKKGYELASETALGESVQAVVVAERAEAMKILNLLDETKSGKCKIIIAEEYYSNQDTHDTESSSADSLKPIINYITSQKENYLSLFKKLLADKYIVESRKIGVEYCRQDNNIYKSFITLDGELFQKGRFLAGSSSQGKQEFSLIGRESVIKELSNNISNLESLIDNKESRMKEFKEKISNLEKKLEIINKDIQMVKDNKHDKENIRENFESELQRVKDECLVVKTDIQEVTFELSDLKDKKKESEGEKEKISNEVESKHKLISDYQNNIEKLTHEKEKLIVQKGKLESEISRIVERKQSNKEKVDMLNNLLDEQQQKLNDSEIEKSNSNKKIASLQQEIQDYQDKINEFNLERERIVSELNRLKEEKKECLVIKKEFEPALNKQQEIAHLQRQELQQLNMTQTQLKYKLEQIENRMKDKYNKNLKDFVFPDSESGRDINQLEENINALSRKLESMGPVSLMAIEEYEELQERHSFLTEQRQDLLHAEESLRKAIRKINKTTRSLFLETFEKIQVEFDNFFKSLFNGGKALLKFTDESDVLESGIEIIAQPKGKKLQNISLLSGGEKALTAIALLFAIFKVKPSPFCLLDEIDAPLDEANIDRFSRLLEEFIETSQFIIITHNKKTISLADIIYGVTMEKSGISKIVSVKLIDEKEKEMSAVNK